MKRNVFFVKFFNPTVLYVAYSPTFPQIPGEPSLWSDTDLSHWNQVRCRSNWKILGRSVSNNHLKTQASHGWGWSQN